MSATLALGELGGLARLVEAGLLALDDAGIAGQEAFALERDAQVRVGLDERAGDSVPDRAGLAARSAAVDADTDVELALDLGHLQRRQRELPVDDPRKVLLDRPAVEPGRAVARTEDDAGDRGLALAGAAVLRLLGHQLVTFSSVGAWASCGCSGPA